MPTEVGAAQNRIGGCYMARFRAYVRGCLVAVASTAGSVTVAEPYVFPDTWIDVPAAEVVGGGVLHDYTTGVDRTFNPLVSVESNVVVGMNRSSAWGAAVLGWIRPDDGSMEPRAAESWVISDDGLTFDVTLRPELRWSDGTPIDAQDYLISYEVSINPDIGGTGPEVWSIDGELIRITVTGEHSLRFEFPAPDRLALDTVAYHYPLPDHIFGEAFRTGGAEAVNALWDTGTRPEDLVFSGFMRLKEVTFGERLVFERNPYFGEWNVDAAGTPLPYLDGVTMRILERDTAFTLFLAGELDVYTPRNLDDVSVVSAAVANHGLDALVVESAYPMESTYFLAFNWNLASDPFKEGLFRNPDFRKAIAHLVDREAIIALVHSGAGFPLVGGVHPSYSPWFDEELDAPGYEPEEAIRLLEGIGFTSWDAQGYLVDDQGRRVSFTLMVAGGSPFAEDATQILADSIREVGVDISVDPVPFALLVDLVTTRGPDRGFDAVYVGLTPAASNWPFANDVHECDGGLHLYNLSGDCLTVTERLMAELVVRGRSTLDDEEATRIAHEIQRLEMQLGAIIYTTVPAVHYISSGRVAGHLRPELWGPQNGFDIMFLNSLRQGSP